MCFLRVLGSQKSLIKDPCSVFVKEGLHDIIVRLSLYLVLYLFHGSLLGFILFLHTFILSLLMCLIIIVCFSFHVSLIYVAKKK